jgi:hypothetical protein
MGRVAGKHVGEREQTASLGRIQPSENKEGRK